MAWSLKRKITLSTILGAIISIFFGFAVNHPKEWYWRLFGLLFLCIVVWVNNLETNEEKFYQIDMETRNQQKIYEQEMIKGQSEALKKRNEKISGGDLQGAKDWDDYLSNISK